MADKRNNYCQLLGLNPLKETSYTVEAILKKIETKKGKWANESRNKQNDTEQRFKAERLVNATADMERVMKDPLLRRREFTEAAQELKGKAQKIRQDCVILTDGTYLVLPGVAEPFAKKLHWEGVTKADIVKLAGVKEGQPPKPVSDKVLNAYKGLRGVDVYSPIELLNNLITHPNLEINLDPLSDGSSPSQIRNAFEVCDKRVNSVRPDILPEQDSYIQTLRVVKLVLEPDKELSSLISYGKCNKALVPVMETIEEEYNNQQLTRKYIDELMSVHLTREVDNSMAIQILQAFCFKKKIAANFSHADSSMMRCPECGHMVPAGPDTSFCPACGKNFKTVCPACNTPQQSNNSRCIKCGFDFKEGMQKAKSLEMSFRMNIQGGHLARAEKDLNNLRDTFASYPGLNSLQGQLTKAQTSVMSMTKNIGDSYNKKRFFDVKTATESLIEQYPEILKEDPELKHRYEDARRHFDAAEMYCQKAAVAETRDQRMAQYVSAVEMCSDHPTARNKLREQPPQGPADPIGRIGEKNFLLKFEPPADSANVTYCIYRERNSLPSNITEDTRPIAEIPSTSFNDRTVEPGVEYYYSVYSKRWGVLSREGAHIGPIMILSEVENVHIEPIDGGLRIMYEKPRGCTRVRLWRTEDSSGNGTGIEIALNGETVYDDTGLTGGKKYYYLFVAEYEARNRVERSAGNMFAAIPVDAPQPVKDMQIRWNKSDGSFTAKWSTKEQVDLYITPKRISIPGKLVKMDDIRSWMTKVEPIQEYADGARFMLPDGAVQYVYPIIPRGKMGVKGTEAMVANVKPFRDVKTTLSNRDCILTMIWPPEAIEAKVVISNNEVRDLNDVNAEILTVRREEYQEEKLIRIPMGKSVKKCLNIFAIYRVGDEDIPSRGLAVDVYSAECKKVRYNVKEDRSGTTLEITTDKSVTELPQIIAVQVDVGIPLKRCDGEVVWRSDQTVRLSGGAAQITIPKGKIGDIKRMRLFFDNEENYYLYRFVHPLYRRD